ncbi:hypothetical protein QW131_19145 [Roseibium salinum]|nr:hypothetical protein [Roseibium salinum]
MGRFANRLAFTLQLGLLNGLFAIIIVSPAIVAAYQHMLAAQVVPATLSVNLADYAVSQYLRGGIALPAQDFSGAARAAQPHDREHSDNGAGFRCRCRSVSGRRVLLFRRQADRQPGAARPDALRLPPVAAQRACPVAAVGPCAGAVFPPAG